MGRPAEFSTLMSGMVGRVEADFTAARSNYELASRTSVRASRLVTGVLGEGHPLADLFRQKIDNLPRYLQITAGLLDHVVGRYGSRLGIRSEAMRLKGGLREAIRYDNLREILIAAHFTTCALLYRKSLNDDGMTVPVRFKQLRGSEMQMNVPATILMLAQFYPWQQAEKEFPFFESRRVFGLRLVVLGGKFHPVDLAEFQVKAPGYLTRIEELVLNARQILPPESYRGMGILQTVFLTRYPGMLATSVGQHGYILNYLQAALDCDDPAGASSPKWAHEGAHLDQHRMYGMNTRTSSAVGELHAATAQYIQSEKIGGAERARGELRAYSPYLGLLVGRQVPTTAHSLEFYSHQLEQQMVFLCRSDRQKIAQFLG